VLWFTVWTVLVLATLGGAFLLGRRLWRSAVALGHELGRASEVADRLAVRAEELRAAAESRPPVGPTLFADRDELRVQRDLLRAQRQARREARGERDARTRESWRAYWR